MTLTIHILTDSSHYQQPTISQEFALHLLPFRLNLDEVSYHERVDITTPERFNKLMNPNIGWPVSSAITTGTMQAVFDRLTAHPDDQVVGIYM